MIEDCEMCKKIKLNNPDIIVICGQQYFDPCIIKPKYYEGPIALDATVRKP